MALESQPSVLYASPGSPPPSGKFSNTTDDTPNNQRITDRSHAGNGILSRTVIRSPAVHTILPARIRSKQQNDVVFVGEDFIQILELRKDGYLDEVATKTDFGSTILSAKIIGSADDEVEDFIDKVVKQEQGSPGNVMEWSQDRPSEPSPQLLVLVLDSKQVVFLFGKDTSHGSVEFPITTRALPRELFSLPQIGELIAVDSKSRAMAIGAPFGYVGVMALKTRDQIKQEPGNKAIQPITEERYFRTDGIILQMDFLLPPVDRPQSAVLLLLVSKNGSTHMILYEWDTTLGLQHSTTTVGCTGQRLDSSDSVPLILIPSALSTSFMLVCEHGLSSYSNVLGETATRRSVPLPRKSLNDFKGSSSNPLWVQWARPQRNILRRGVVDDVYLCREDGLVHFMEIKKAYAEEDSIKVSVHFSTGPLYCNVDKAFAVMGGNLHDAADILLAAGDMSDGGVYQCFPREIPTRSQVIPNWAPLTDMVIIKNKDTEGDNSRDRLFACSGRGEGYGTVAELRTGLEAKVGVITTHEDAVSMNAVWALPDVHRGHLILITSHPDFSNTFLVDAVSGDFEALGDDNRYGFTIDSITLAAGFLRPDILLQVTPSEINVVRLASDSTYPHHAKIEGATLILAAIVDYEWPTVVDISRHNADQSPRLNVRQFVLNDTSKGSQNSLWTADIDFDPTSISARKASSSLVICIGSSRGTVLLFSFKDGSITKLDEISLIQAEHYEASSLDSIAMINSPGHSSSARFIVLAGFRNGLLVSKALTFNERANTPTLEYGRGQCRKLGSTSINITQDAADSGAAFVGTGRDLRYVSIDCSREDGRFSIENIWFTDRNDISMNNPIVRATARVPLLPDWDDQILEGALICVTDDSLWLSACASRPQAVPRRIPVRGNPFRLAYLEHMHKLVVGVELRSITKYRSRCTRPGIELVDVDPSITGETVAEPYLVGKVGERITCIAHWTPKTKDKTYGMIVIGTRIDRSDPTSSDGRLVFVTADNTAHGVKVKHKRTYRFIDRPIYSLASLGNNYLIVGLGNTVLLQSLDFATRRWQRKAEYRLPSPALQLSVLDQEVQITTAKHSVLCLKVESDQFKLVANDQQARLAVSHTMLSKGPVLAAAGADGSVVVGFEHGRQQDFQASFEVHLPHHISRLRAASGQGVDPDGHDSFYGICVDGRTYHFTKLSDNEWCLLHFVQSLHKQDLQPIRKSSLKSRERSLQPADMHINGDLLHVVIERGPGYLQELIWSGGSRGRFSKRNGIPAADDRMSEFSNLVRESLGTSESPITAFITWARNLLNSCGMNDSAVNNSAA